MRGFDSTEASPPIPSQHIHACSEPRAHKDSSSLIILINAEAQYQKSGSVYHRQKMIPGWYERQALAKSRGQRCSRASELEIDDALLHRPL